MCQQKIINYLKNNEWALASEILTELKINRQSLNRGLRSLLKFKEIETKICHDVITDKKRLQGIRPHIKAYRIIKKVPGFYDPPWGQYVNDR